MKTSLILKTTLTAVCLATLATGTASASVIYSTDSFGSGANSFGIQFASVGNAGNGNDAGAGGGIYSSPYGGVSYQYRIGVTEVPKDWIDKATNLGMTNVTAGWSGSKPATNMTWFESAAFVNYLNTSTGHAPAYNLTWTGTAWTMNLWSSGQAWQVGGQNLYRNKDAYYFLPSENEWYKAAYHKNDGVTANFWDYPTASNAIPDGLDISGDTAFDAVFFQGYFQYTGPNSVTNVGLASAYGTVGQGGNVWEWAESAYDGSNTSASEDRAFRGGGFGSSETDLRSLSRANVGPAFSSDDFGLRVASIEPVPEPTSTLTGLLCLGVAALRRRRSRGSHIGSTAPQ